MTNREYAELLDSINDKTVELPNVSMYRVHSSYDPSNNQINKVTLKVNYTKDGKPLPESMKGKLPKNVVQRSVQFRGDDCNKETIENWIDDFMKEKGV